MMKKLGKPNLKDIEQFVKEYEFPTDLLVEVTASCNLNCIMCPQDQLTRPQGTMSFELWKKIIDEIVERSPDTRVWPAVMGEPLLVEQIFEMLKYAKEKDIKYICLNTNLMAFRKDMIDSLFDSNVDELLVGFDGFTAETYEKIRVNGKFETLMENLNFIIDEKVKRGLDSPLITLQYIVMDENEHEEQAFIDYWKNAGKRVRLKIRHKLGWGDGVEPSKHMVVYKQNERFMPCTWLLRQMTVLWDGSVPMCDNDWNGKTNYGNINKDSLDDVWKRLKVIRDRHMNLDFDYTPCDKCDDWQAGRALIIECGE